MAQRFASPWQRFLDALVYVGVRLAEAMVRSSPPERSEALARALARAYYRVSGERRATTLENLRIAFGGSLSEAERERLAVRTFEHTFVLLSEVFWRPRLAPGSKGLRRLGVVHGDEEEAREDLRAGRGAVCLTGHVGNWELAAAFLRSERVPFAAVARPFPNPFVDAHLASLRGGAERIIEKRGAVRDVVAAIRRGAWVGVLADQNAGRRGVFVPFFGLPASSYRFAATLAARHGFPVYFAAAIRRGGRFRYEYRIHRWRPPAGLSRHETERHILEAYSARLESWVREVPEQYLWLHRRWKTRPPGEKPGPHLPSYIHRDPVRRAAREAQLRAMKTA